MEMRIDRSVENTDLLDDLFLQVERGSNDCDGIGLEVSSVGSVRGMHGNELLKLSTTINDPMMGTQNEFEQFCDWPCDHPLEKVFIGDENAKSDCGDIP